MHLICHGIQAEGRSDLQTPVPLLPIPVAPKTPENPRLSKIIAVAGSVAAPDDFIDLWRGLSSADSERFCLVWETAELMALNSSIVNMLLSQVHVSTCSSSLHLSNQF